MTDLFTSPHLADLILAVLLLEGILLGVMYTRTGRGLSPRAAAPFLLSGAFLALALRGALSGAGWPWIAAPMVGALVAHLWDLRERGR